MTDDQREIDRLMSVTVSNSIINGSGYVQATHGYVCTSDQRWTLVDVDFYWHGGGDYRKGLACPQSSQSIAESWGSNWGGSAYTMIIATYTNGAYTVSWTKQSSTINLKANPVPRYVQGWIQGIGAAGPGKINLECRSVAYDNKYEAGNYVIDSIRLIITGQVPSTDDNVSNPVFGSQVTDVEKNDAPSTFSLSTVMTCHHKSDASITWSDQHTSQYVYSPS